MAYYIRFTDEAQKDLDRGYSFVGFLAGDTEEGLILELSVLAGEYDYNEDCPRADYVDEIEWRIAQHDNGQYGIAYNGLLGYGPFETIEAAKEELSHRRNLGHFKNYDNSNAVIFEGTPVHDDFQQQDDGDMFKAIAIVWTED
jgi:hypothetical protein